MSVAADHASTNLAKYTTRNPVYRWHMQAFERFVVDMVTPAEPGSILDAGCGEGYFTSAIKAACPSADVVGVDASDGAVRYATERFGDSVSFRVGNIFALPFADDSFDVVLCSEVLEHLDNPAAAFSELRRIARRRVVLTVPLEPYFKFFNDIARALGISEDPGHVQFWSHAGFKDFVSSLHPGATFGKVHYYQGAVCDL